MEENIDISTSSEPLKQTSAGPVQQTIIVRPEPRKTNGLGVAGFVLSLVALFGCWIPFLNWIAWFLGFLFSFIGIFKAPRGLAIAGLCISLIGLVILVVLLLGFFGLAIASI